MPEELTWEDLEAKLHDACRKLYKHDKHLINANASERSMVFRVALYLQEAISQEPWMQGLDIDCEYNRDGKFTKTISTRNKKEKLIIPDLVIHERDQDGRNLLVVEFKKTCNPHRKEDAEIALRIKEAYQYRFAATIVFDKNGAIITQI